MTLSVLRKALVLLVVWLTASVAGAQTIRFMSYNVKSFEGPTETTQGKKYVMEPFFEAFDKVSPDVCVINELEIYTDALGNRNPLAELASHLGVHYYFCKSYDRVELDRGAGYYGNGLLSKYPILSMECRRLSMPAGAADPRSVFWADLLLPSGQQIRIVGTHLDHMAGQGTQLSEILNITEIFDTSLPIVMMGDFNTDPYTVKLTLDKHQSKLSIRGNQWVDYILSTPHFKPGALFVESFPVTKDGETYTLSDHAAIYMDLTL